ncbi:MAG: TonB-dependent receptor plug domain-containing protein [Flavobacteriaceae bacterium]|nr:TonB-dependent receptor plug domain-containing protein [Flavobacteriaceae bacterium]
MAQKKFDYNSKWKEIEKQEQDGLLKSVLPAVNSIYAQAKKDKNSQEIIRALLYQSKIAIATSDDDDTELQIVENFQKEIFEAKGMEKSVLQSMLAELYFNYYQENQWKINQRTETAESTGNDFRFWTENIFQQKSAELYLQSIENQKELQNEPIGNWDYLLTKVEESRSLRPTLYDFLAHRAIQFFQTENNYYYRGNYDAKSNEEKKEKVWQILKDLSAFHLQKNNQDAYLYNQFELLKAETNDRNSDEYLNELIALSKKFPTTEYNAYILFEIANFHLTKAANEEPKAFDKKKVSTEKTLSVLNEIQTKYPKSSILIEAEKLQKQILSSDFRIQVETYISPDLNTPIRVSHKNLDKLYFKVLKYNEDLLMILRRLPNDFEKYKQQNLDEGIKKSQLEKEFQLDLKTFDDYQEHSTIAKLDPLKSGRYLVLASNNADFQVSSEGFVFQYQILDVSAYSIVFRENEILVTERESGIPAVKQKVDVFETKNNKESKVKTLTTNEFGIADVNYSKENYRTLAFKMVGEEVSYHNYYYRNHSDNSPQVGKSSKIFTDRAIYRPGQTVYFKVIHYQTNKDETKTVLKDFKTYVSLYDVNDQLITYLELTTNDFGSVSGEFILPSGGLTGQYYIKDTNSAKYYFSVEEYKRPRFEVEFEDVKDTFKLEEEITAKGKATAYSGANIDNAKVVYRVYRQAIYPYWPWWKRGSFPQSEPAEEITHGETMTDADGKFEVKFNAKAAPVVSSSLNDRSSGAEDTRSPRTYTYRIVADIIDLNGETRSSEQSITVGDLRFMLNIPVADRIEISEFDSIPIVTNNLNGQFVPAKGKITLTKINPPSRVLRDSPLQPTDYELYPKDEFINYFPHEAYGDENQKENWAKETPVLNENFDTEKSKSLKINPKNWKEGTYILRGFILDGKDSIPHERLVYLYRNEKKSPVDNEIFNATLNQSTYKPGETAVLNLTSATENSEVLVQLEADGKIIKSEKIKLNNNVNNFRFPIDEKHRGNVFLHYYFGKFNTAKSGTITVNVPQVDTSLKITAGTLRDKLQPGQEEIWELTVSGEGKDKFLAEMLATMYDASLDQFKSNSINFPMGIKTNYSSFRWNTYQSFGTNYFNYLIQNPYQYYYPNIYLAFDELNWFGFGWNQYEQRRYMMMKSVAPVGNVADALQGQVAGIALEESAVEMEVVTTTAYSSANVVTIRGNSTLEDNPNALIVVDGVIVNREDFKAESVTNINVLKGDEATAIYGARGANGVIIITTKQAEEKLNQVQARSNLQETAFFYPNLRTDEKGNVKIQFTTPESLTSWKFMATAHTPDLRTGYFETTVRTQKELMVVPNPPRFLREGDQITFSSKITNLSDKELSGQAKLMLFDAFTMQPVDAEFNNTNATKNISVSKGNSTEISWTLNIPQTRQAIVYRVVASASDFSDGEESALPILSNRMMVTETLPIHVREGQIKTFTLDKLKNNQSESLDHFKLTFEMTSNPIWYAIFSLPYLREYPYECSEQVFARLYGNMISQHIIHSNPKIKAVFDDWNAKGELVSKLEQNQELKSLLLEETPWVRDAQSEEEQMKRIAVLFDLNKMRNELQSAYQKLAAKQSGSGGFPWFEGGDDNRYITTHIVSGFGHLKEMGIDYESNFDINSEKILEKAIEFIDNEMEKEFDKYLKNNKLTPSVYNGIQYLYARSYFLEKYPMSKKANQAKDYFLKELDKGKFEQGLQTQAMLAMIFNRFGKKDLAVKILNSIKDNSVESDEMGMYWKSNVAGWFWYQAPIETQAMLIEAFDEVLSDVESVESMKVWLLKNRQTNQWSSTKSTTEAVFALMSTGKDWANAEEGISVKIGGENLDLKKLEKAPQSGSGYVKTSWDKEEIQPEMAIVNVQKTSPGVAWGAMYWQYFEDLDQITSAETGVKFRKELFLKKNSDSGPVLTKITENTPIQIGDLVTVRLEIQTDREMEFVHIKDMRASGFEPTNVLSTYKWQQGMGYYESTRDAATNFFIDRMPKGTYVFEYDVRANNAGNFSNGITSLQNMYAPELSAHSEGIRVEIE